MHVIILTGLSGSGKSTAIKALEDEGFYCLDNLPLTLVPSIVELSANSKDLIEDIAFVIDIRGKDYLKGNEDIFQNLRSQGHLLDIIFLECSDQVIIRRYSETRRRHPALDGATITESIRYEREQLAALRRTATLVIDTSEMNVHRLRDTIIERVREGVHKRDISVNVQSFGFRYGIPPESDLVFDVRFISNPYFVPELKSMTGLDEPVRDYVIRQSETASFIEKLKDMLDFLIPLYRKEGKSYLTISIGCTGGRHRSVTITEIMGKHICNYLSNCRISHRDIERG